MAEFAKLVLKTDPIDNIEKLFVEDLIVVDDSTPAGNGTLADNPKHVDGENYCSNLCGADGAVWKQSFPNKEHRGRGANIDGYYDATKDIFVNARPFNAWVLNSEGTDWESPVTPPTQEQSNNYDVHWSDENSGFLGFDQSGNKFIWNVNTLTWDSI
jgi:hypothetical protein|tara:strand:+ start:215 stop:685 length:471 start_codon:yes stop_codon:yes gene_type:complete